MTKYEIKLSDCKKYVIIKVNGEVTAQKAMQWNIEAHKLGKANNTKKFFVDFSEAVNADSVGNNYDFANSDLPNSPEIDRTAIVAVVVSPNDHSHDFIETVAHNSGQTLKIFVDKEEALDYLLKRSK